ncbi:hypothetical protein [Brumimicrobium oceani]|uniref:Lipoprotein n=1 Tax=Brumimicrobium oceani TaxID=2100725 RepID=A0A2U2X0Q5_9FLAO|nr:hypothetical protein [Brumimicrobium oceani]PWH81367.1 hypothetical protein DIT68_15175 [Brumimicrobium oceani]
MVWLKKVIFFILSAVLIALSSCESNPSKSELEEEKVITKDELISSFFSQIQNWSSKNMTTIDSLGFKISALDSTLTFLPSTNEYEPGGFLFTAKNKSAFKDFEENTFLSEQEAISKSNYKIWRKKIKNLQILDLSIEPHPVLGWLFVIRKRGQE